MKKVIITGADGFIGSHLIKYLVSYNYEVFALVRQSDTHLNNINNVNVFEVDLEHFDSVIESLPNEVSAFFHFAWNGVSSDFRNDYVTQLQNVNLAISAAKLASRLNARKFIFPGSTLEYAYYGRPIDSQAVPSPLNAYGVAKISARYACSLVCRELKLPYIYTVISSIYSEDRKDNNVIYYTIDKLLHGDKPSLTKLEQMWDYVHIDDVLLGLKLIAEKGKPNSFYSLGHGDNCPLSNYIYQIRDLINPNLELGIGDIPYLNGKTPSSCVDLELIMKDTGYVPKIPFNFGIAKVINKLKNSLE